MAAPAALARWRWRLVSLIALARGQCYLEDATATCAACWLTDEDGDQMLGRCKRGGVTVEWLNPLPETLRHGIEYTVEYRFSINTSIYPVVPVAVGEYANVRVQLPHMNLHSCYLTGMACTPFIEDSPGLSTHTAALSGNLTISQDKDILCATVRQTVSLEEGRYTIIAHSRFFIPGGNGLIQVDTAAGVKRAVLPLDDAVTDPSAYVGAGGFGAVMLIVTVSLVWAAKSGRLDLDSLLTAITRDEVVVVADCIFGLADVAAYSVGLWTEISVHPALKDIVPLSYLFLVTGWTAFLLSLACNVKELLLSVQRRHYEQMYIERTVMKVRSGHSNGDDQDTKKRDSVLSQHVTGKRLIVQYAQASTKSLKMYAGVATLIFTDIPLASIGGYTLAVGDQSLLVVAVAMISSTFVGVKLHGITSFRHNKEELLRSANALLDYLDDSPADFSRSFSGSSNLMHLTGRQPRRLSQCSEGSPKQSPQSSLMMKVHLTGPGQSPSILEHGAQPECDSGSAADFHTSLSGGSLVANSVNLASLMQLTGRKLRQCPMLVGGEGSVLASECSDDSDKHLSLNAVHKRVQLAGSGKPPASHEHAAQTEKEEGPKVPRELQRPCPPSAASTVSL